MLISGTAEPERNWEIISSKFRFPRIKPSYNGKDLVQNHTMRSEVEPSFSYTLQDFSYHSNCLLLVHTSFCYIFPPFESVFCTYESRVLTYLLSHHQYSYLCRHLSRKGILPSSFMKSGFPLASLKHARQEWGPTVLVTLRLLLTDSWLLWPQYCHF